VSLGVMEIKNSLADDGLHQDLRVCVAETRNLVYILSWLGMFGCSIGSGAPGIP